jgi:hypothetical protein
MVEESSRVKNFHNGSELACELKIRRCLRTFGVRLRLMSLRFGVGSDDPSGAVLNTYVGKKPRRRTYKTRPDLLSLQPSLSWNGLGPDIDRRRTGRALNCAK